MGAYILKGGRAFVNGRFEETDILVKNGLIAAIGKDIRPENVSWDSAEVIDCGGLTITPGLVDLHVHLREPGFEYKETILSGTRAAARGGFTTICPMPNLNPVPDSLEHLRAQLEIIDRDASINVLPFGAITVGEKGAKLAGIEDIAPYVAGFSDDGKGVQDRDMMARAMELAKGCGRIISAHCEDESLLEGGSIHKGEYAEKHNMKGICSASEYAPIERDIELAEKCGARYHICHISAKESIELVRQGKKRGIKVTCEATPHHIALCDMDITEDSGRFKMNPPLRGREDREAIWQGLRDGTIDCIATDHAPHSAEEKAKGLEKSAFGTVGSETAFSACYTTLVKGGIISLERLVELITSSPAAIIGRRAELREGARADIAVFDLDESYIVDPEDFASKGRSTPFEGAKLWGVTRLTMCGGRIVYEHMGRK